MNIRIEKYDNEGRGIGYYNRKIVFVNGVIVGEIVKVKPIIEKDKYIICKLVQIVKPSPIRLNVKCPYYNRCGGCSFMHLSCDEEIRIKEKVIRDLFYRERLDIPSIKVINSKNKYNYRNKIKLKVLNGEFGYYDNNSHDFIKIDNCDIAKDSINNIIKSNDLFKMYNGEIIIRSNYNNEILIKIISDRSVFVDVDKLILDNKIVGIVVNDKVVYGEEYFIEKVNNYLFKVNIDSFFQVNLDVLEKIEELLREKELGNVVDLYCGVGTLGMFVKKNNLYGIEVQESSVLNAISNSKMNKQNNSYMLGDSSKISKINDNIDSIIIDPPRSGLSKDTIKNILHIKPNNLIYMSCNPITFVRDIKILCNLYDIEDFYLLDMFPRTRSIECFVVLRRKKS